MLPRKKNNKRKYVKRNLYKKNNQGKVNLIDKEIRFLEELVVSEEEIFEKSTEITSLIEIQRKQNIRHGLTNVTDACFEFFIEMDKKIRDRSAGRKGGQRSQVHTTEKTPGRVHAYSCCGSLLSVSPAAKNCGTVDYLHGAE